MFARLLILLALVLCTSAYANYVPPAPSAAPVTIYKDSTGGTVFTTNLVAEDDLVAIQTWEDGPLFLEKRGFSTLIYPLEDNAQACSGRKCENGCTIGFGYNFGAHTRQKIWSDFKAAGIPEYTITPFLKLAKKTGVEALKFCGSHTEVRTVFPSLDYEQSFALAKVMIAQHKLKVINRAIEEDVLGHLNEGMLSVLVALDYQNPNLSSEATNIWKYLKVGNIDGVVNEIRNNSGSQKDRQLTDRRRWEANRFKWASNLLKEQVKAKQWAYLFHVTVIETA